MRSAAAPRVDPNLVLGIVGGGQLAQMTAAAAARLHVPVRVLRGPPGTGAALGTIELETGSAMDRRALRRFISRCDVVTFDHENVDRAVVRELDAAGAVLRPGPATLALACDKTRQRQVLEMAGLPVPRFALVATPAEAVRFSRSIGRPIVLKAPSGGYDGRGVWDAPDAATVAAAFAAGGGRPLLAEERLALDTELSVLVARRPTGDSIAYPPVATIQKNGICHTVSAPAMVDRGVADAATSLARDVADLAGAVGILAVELFLSHGKLLVNELAARPHNSGHLTIEASRTSQFENHVRAVLDLPLGDPGPVAPAAAMANVLAVGGSDPRTGLDAALSVPGASVHLYGKTPWPGRKIGHVTALGDHAADALVRAQDAARALAEATR